MTSLYIPHSALYLENTPLIVTKVWPRLGISKISTPSAAMLSLSSGGTPGAPGVVSHGARQLQSLAELTGV